MGPAARALCTLSPWPLQAHLSPTPGASTGLPCRHLVCLFGQTTWQFWLQLNGPAAGSNPSRRRPRPRAESRWGQGYHGPPPHSPFFTLASGPLPWVLNVGVTNLLWEGVLSGGSWSWDVVCSVVGWCSHPHPSPTSQVKPGTQVLFLSPFQDALATDFCWVRGGSAEGGESEVPGAATACPTVFQSGAPFFRPQNPLSRAWRLVRSPAGPSLGGGWEWGEASRAHKL